ncbi:hepatitis A virus cellular receptor 1 homolog isoform X2 [Trachinotus anak]|uniref:hepatitis A virus cellular receptor 1 homolog isoform X2 n=1 Tax=Trachinotus anak TaxID=443729 RepID=UPI0039F18AB7
MWSDFVSDDSLSALIMTIVLLLALLTVAVSDSRTVVGRTGESVTLPCTYDVKHHGRLSVCWNRGDIPMSGCNNQIISTDGPSRVSSRYQLLGRVEDGDVSMTIVNLTETDAGRYGCRVEIPGWFNDDKHHFDLRVEPATTTTPSNTQMSTQQTTANETTGQMITTRSNLTSPSSSTITSLTAQDSSSVSVVLVCVLFGLIVLVTVGGVIIIAKKWRHLNKMPQRQQVTGSVQLQTRGPAVENIYQIDAGGDGGEYEYCP